MQLIHAGHQALELMGRVSHRFTRWMSRIRDELAAVFFGPGGAVFLVAATTVFYRLGRRPLWWYDESFYAIAARYAVDHGYWLIPRVAGFDTIHPSPFLEKPPLAIWLEAVAVGILGPTEFAVRVPSAAAAVATAVLVYALGRRLHGRAAGVVAAAVFLTTPAVIVGTNGARFGATDTLHTFFGSLLVVLIWFHATSHRDVSPVLVGVVASALVLTKGFAAGVFVVAFVPLLIRHSDRFPRRFIGIATGLTTALVGWWAVAAYLLEGHFFIQEIFIEQVWERLVSQKVPVTYETAVPFLKYPYPTEVQGSFRPWWFLFLAGAVTLVAPTRNDGPGPDTRGLNPRFLLWWVAAILLPFAFTGTRMWYLLPMYVPAAVVVGWLVGRAIDGSRRAMIGVGTGTALAAFAGRDGALYVLGAEGQIILDQAFPPDWTVAIVMAVLYVGGRLLTADILSREPMALPGEWSFDTTSFGRMLVVGVTLSIVAITLVGTPSVYAAGAADESADRELKRLGERTNEVVPVGERVYVQPNAAARWHYLDSARESRRSRRA